MMKGTLEVCYHREDDQHIKKIAGIQNSGDPIKSFHLEFSYGDEKFLLSLYHDTFGLFTTAENGELDKELFYRTYDVEE